MVGLEKEKDQLEAVSNELAKSHETLKNIQSYLIKEQ
jgi:hypothetical protein